MMSRIRTIKPEFWKDETIGSLSLEARLVFIGCWNLADDEGLLKLSPHYIRSEIFAYDDITLDQVKKILGELTERSLIFPYQDRKSQSYGWIVNFRKHQRIDKPQGPKNPVPCLQNPEVKKAYAERDGHTCHLCGGEVSLTEANEKLVLSLDHLKPRGLGGGDEPSNIKVAHFGCNASRCDREDHPETSKEQLQEHSENNPGTVPSGKEQGKEGKGKEKDKDAQPRFSPLGFLLQEGADQKLAKDWLSVRTTKKLAGTETALTDFLSEVGKSGKTIDEILKICVVKGWGGFEASWLKNQRSAARVEEDVFAGCI